MHPPIQLNTPSYPPQHTLSFTLMRSLDAPSRRTLSMYPFNTTAAEEINPLRQPTVITQVIDRLTDPLILHSRYDDPFKLHSRYVEPLSSICLCLLPLPWCCDSFI